MLFSHVVKFNARATVLPSHGLIQLPGLLSSYFSAVGEGVGVWGAPASPLDVISQYNLAKDAVQALYQVHGIEYIYGSISTTLCECASPLAAAVGVTPTWGQEVQALC